MIKAAAHGGHIDIQIDAHHAVLTAEQADDLTAAIAVAQMAAAAQRAAAADRLAKCSAGHVVGSIVYTESPPTCGCEWWRSAPAGSLTGPPWPTVGAVTQYAGRHREPYPVSPEVGGPFYAASADAPDYQHPDDDDE